MSDDAVVPRFDVADASADGIGTSSIVSMVFETLLHEVHNGTLAPGDRVRDGELAQRFGVSRTPIREALQRLREIGIIEASANRFTRISVVSPQQTANALVVFRALYAAVVAEVISDVEDEVIAGMEADQNAFYAGLLAGDMSGVAAAGADFFNHLVRLSRNPALQHGILAVVHVIQLGSLHLPEQLDLVTLNGAQLLLIDAARNRDSATAARAMLMLGAIQVPTEFVEITPDDPHYSI